MREFCTSGSTEGPGRFPGLLDFLRKEDAVKSFVARYRSLVTGVLSGFDRLVFRGSLLPLIRRGGLYLFLEAAKVRLLDFKKFALATTERVK